MIMTTGEVHTGAGRPVLHGAFIVTGAASGLGLAIAKAIGGAGGSPIGFDLNTALRLGTPIGTATHATMGHPTINCYQDREGR